MSRADARNYQKATGHERCGTCAYFRDGFCTLFDFKANPSYTCDSWVSSEETHTAGGRSVVEKHAGAAELMLAGSALGALAGHKMSRKEEHAARRVAKGGAAGALTNIAIAAPLIYGLSREYGIGAGKTVALLAAGMGGVPGALVSLPKGKTKKAGVPFLKQDRPEKVKEIYRALKRDHPNMPPEMKARIAAKQGKPGKQKQGPPYKGPIRSEYTTAMRKRDKTMQKRSELEKTALLNWMKGLFKKQPDPMKVLQAAKKKARYGGADLYGKVGGPAAPAVQLERLKAARNIEKISRVLSARGRRQISEENFALPGRRYPIHDRSHARNALSRVAQHGTPAEKARVRAAVERRYPGIGQEKTAMPRFPRIPMPELPTISRGSRRALAAAGVGTAAGGAGGFVGGEVHGKKEMRGSMFTPQEVQYAYRKGQQDVIKALRARQMQAHASSMPKSASAKAQFLKKMEELRKAKMKMPYGSKVPYPTPGAPRPSTPGIPGLPAGRNFPGTTPPISPAGRNFPGTTPPMFPGKMKLSHVDPSNLYIPKSILGF